MVRTVADAPRSTRGVAIALLTVPGVLVAHLLTTGAAPSARTTLVVTAVVALVAAAVPARSARSTAAVAGLAQLAAHGILALTGPGEQARAGCLSVVGHGAETGVRYALARQSCPPGTLATTGTLVAVAAALGAAVLVLAGHAALAALTAALAAVAAAGLRAARRLADAVRPMLLLVARPRVVAVRPLPLPLPAPLASLWRPGAPLLRGPPSALRAV